MLVGQAQTEDMWVASNETIFETADVRRYW
jgi:hypothetical protein